MVDYVEPIMQVLTGGGAEGLTWEVLAREEPGGRFLTVIRRVQGASATESGFKGLKLEPGQLIRYWIGKADGTPAFIVARAAPEVESIIAIGASSVEYPLQMSNLIEQFSLRFGLHQFLLVSRSLKFAPFRRPPSPLHAVSRSHSGETGEL